MIILKHVEHKLQSIDKLQGLRKHLDQTTSQIAGITLVDIWFPKDKNEFVLVLDCASEKKYLEWREICPPPAGAKDWYEILLTREEHFRP
jgi:hypothetical protein